MAIAPKVSADTLPNFSTRATAAPLHAPDDHSGVPGGGEVGGRGGENAPGGWGGGPGMYFLFPLPVVFCFSSAYGEGGEGEALM